MQCLRRATAGSVALSLTMATHGAGQEMAFDSVSGNYELRVMIEGELVTKTVVPADKVELRLVTSVVESGPGLSYSWTLKVSEESPQGIGRVFLACPEEKAAVARRSAVATPDPTGAGPWFGMHSDWGRGTECNFIGGAVPAEPGQTLTVTVETDFLPAVGEVAVVGADAGLTTSFSDVGFDGNVETLRLVAGVDGTSGGWKALRTVVPRRSSEAMTPLIAGVASIAADVDQVCGSAGWVTSRALCADLARDMEAAMAAAETSDRETVTPVLQGLVERLERAEPDAGTALPEARLLFSTNVEWLMRRR